MEDAGFWVAAMILAGVVLAILVIAVRRAGADVTESRDRAIYKDQLAEIERDLARGTIAPDEAVRLRGEVGRRLIDADRAASGGEVPGRGTDRLPWPILATVGAVIVAGSVLAYDRLGAPGYPDMALGARLRALDAAIAERSSQADELARIGATLAPEEVAGLAASLAAETDAGALRAAFADRFAAGETTAARLTAERILAVVGPNGTATDHANHALALVAEAQGYVSPEAETALRAALTVDLTNEVARYLVGEMFLQGGRFDQTFRFWRPLLEDGNPDAPWVAPIRERIGMVAELAGVRYEVPGAPGPGLGDVEAAEELSPAERQAMIEGMVAQLSDRLATDGGTVEEWERLIRSLAVLERLAQAQAIYDEAKVRFEGRPAELSFLRMAAVEGGLNP